MWRQDGYKNIENITFFKNCSISFIISISIEKCVFEWETHHESEPKSADIMQV